MKRRELPQISHIDARAMFHQKFSDFVVAVRTSVVERHQTTTTSANWSAENIPNNLEEDAPFVFSVDISALLQEELHNLHAVVAGRKM